MPHAPGRSNRPPVVRLPAVLNPERDEEAHAEQLAREADTILKRLERNREKSWQDWMAIAERLAVIAQTALHLSGANQRAGRAYNGTMSRLLHKHQLGDPKWRQVRTALLDIWERKAEVEALRAR